MLREPCHRAYLTVCFCFITSLAPSSFVRADYLITLRNAYFNAGINRIARISDDGAYLGEFVPPSEIATSGLSGPTALQRDAAGHILVSSTFDNRVLRFSGTNGAFLGQFAPGSPAPNPAFDGPAAMRYRPNGELLVANLGNAATGFMGTSVSRLDLQTGGAVGNLGDSHQGAAGLLLETSSSYVSEFSGNTVRHYDANGNLLETISDALIAGPTGLARDPITGNLLIASVNGDRIVQFDGISSSTYLQTPSMFFPSGIYFPNSNESFVFSAAVGTILKYELGNPIPSVFIDYNGLGISPNDLLNGVAIGDILRLPLAGDFDTNGAYECADVDALTRVIAAGTNVQTFDMTGDGQVDLQDLATWRAAAGAVLNASGNAVLPGDANLNGSVDGSDFGIWNSHKFTAVADWCRGDFNANGVVDGSDFGIWNSNKFTSADNGSLVPEPAGISGCLGLIGLMVVTRRVHGQRQPPDRARATPPASPGHIL